MRVEGGGGNPVFHIVCSRRPRGRKRIWAIHVSEKRDKGAFEICIETRSAAFFCAFSFGAFSGSTESLFSPGGPGILREYARLVQYDRDSYAKDLEVAAEVNLRRSGYWRLARVRGLVGVWGSAPSESSESSVHPYVLSVLSGGLT